MHFPTAKLKKRLRDRRRTILRQIETVEKSGFQFTDESKVLRLSHIELIKEILKWIGELEKENKKKKSQKHLHELINS